MVPYDQHVVHEPPLGKLQTTGCVTLLAPLPQLGSAVQFPAAPNFAKHAAVAWAVLNVPSATQSPQFWPRPTLDGPSLWTVWHATPPSVAVQLHPAGEPLSVPHAAPQLPQLELVLMAVSQPFRSGAVGVQSA